MKVYVDNAATTKICESAKNAMNNSMEYFWGNPSSIHSIGREANEILWEARKTIAKCINAEPKEIYFTSGGTASNNIAINSYIDTRVVSTAIEHPSVRDKVKHAWRHKLMDVDKDGVLRCSSLYLDRDIYTKFVSVMMANNELGTIQPIKLLADICKYHHIVFHTDAVQAVGHIPIDVKDLGVDMLSASGHKFGGPRGVGFLYVRSGVGVSHMYYGGGQEKCIVPGTENLSGIVGMAVALQEATEHIDERMRYISNLRTKLQDGLCKMSGVIINGNVDERLPGHLNVSFDGIGGNGEGLLMLLDQHGIMASSGSACSSSSNKPSHVLKGIGLSDEMAKSSIRFTLSHLNTEEEIEYIIRVLPELLNYLRLS